MAERYGTDRRRSQVNNRRTVQFNPDYYTEGNNVRVMHPKEWDEQSPKELSHAARRNREKHSHMNFAWVMFLSMAMAATGVVLILYLRLQSDITNRVKNISVLEAEYNSLKAENDDTESRIKGNVDLEAIKAKAMGELGMQYANSDQIVEYDSSDTDYVRQFKDIN
ncbi:MAG: cell division protein FtsL [Lachnospiraceae bacterium]|nr:cell division protein FtsL [Lachnospiraceae bacterium]